MAFVVHAVSLQKHKLLVMRRVEFPAFQKDLNGIQKPCKSSNEVSSGFDFFGKN
jgi:hypothetical protein